MVPEGQERRLLLGGPTTVCKASSVNEERLLGLVQKTPRRCTRTSRGTQVHFPPQLNTSVALGRHVDMLHGYRMNLAAISFSMGA